MNDKRDNFHKQAKSHYGISLSPEQKRAMLASIYDRVGKAAPMTAVASPWSFTFFSAHRYAMASVIVLMLATTTTMASTYSLPGDPLYNFKVNVLEPLQLSLMLSNEERDAFKVRLLERRVEEMRQLREREGVVSTEIQTESLEAAEATLMQVETSAVFDESGGNEEVSGHINTYNSLSDDNFRMDTVIQAKVGNQDNASSSTSTEEMHAKVKATEVIEETEAEVKKKIDEVVPQVEGVVDDVDEVVAPVTEILGL